MEKLDLEAIEARAKELLAMAAEANGAPEQAYELLKVKVAASGIDLAREDIPALVAEVRNLRDGAREALAALTEMRRAAHHTLSFRRAEEALTAIVPDEP